MQNKQMMSHYADLFNLQKKIKKWRCKKPFNAEYSSEVMSYIKHGSTIEGEDLRSHLMPNTALGSCLLYKNGSTISRLPSCK